VISFAHAWTVDGLAVGDDGATLDGETHFDKHQIVGLTLTPWDDEVAGADEIASPLVVANSLPTAPGVSIEPGEIYGGVDDMYCRISISSSDLDGDEIDYSVDWAVDAAGYPGGVSGAIGPYTDALSGDTVPASDVFPLELWTCQITPWDDEDMGPPGMDSVVTLEPLPGCGDGVVDPGEEYEPPPGPYASAPVDEDTCRWDFSEIDQLYCHGACDWAGPPGCDQADADILCKLKMDNPDSVATDWVVAAVLSEPGFASSRCGTGDAIYTDRGVSDVRFQDHSLLTIHSAGTVVTSTSCTDP
jgi:hypothetical protein